VSAADSQGPTLDKPARAPETPKRLIEVLSGSSVITALVTVIGTAIIGNAVAGAIQDKSKKNEIALTAFRENQAAQVAVVTEAYQLLGKYVAASDDLITLTDAYFNRADYPSAEAKKRLESWINEVRSNHDQVDRAWREKKYSLGYLLAYHHSGKRSIAQAWTILVQSVDKFGECSRGWLQEHGEGTSRLHPTRPCAEPFSEVEQNSFALTQSLEADHRYLWEDSVARRE